MADLDGRFFGRVDRTDGIRRTHLGAFRTFGTAMATLVGHFGLHEREESGRGAQHTVRTHRHAKLTARAMLRKVTQASRTRRHERHAAVGRFPVENHGQSAVHLFLLRPGRRGEQQTRTGKESPAGNSPGLPLRSACDRAVRLRNAIRRMLFRQPRAIGDRPVAAGFDAVHTSHATAVVDAMGLAVDAGRLAPAGAQPAAVALLLVDHRAEQGVFRKEAQHGPDGTDRVAIRPAAAPCQHDQHDERDGRHDERRQALDPHVRAIERIAAGPLGEIGQQIVAPTVERSEKVLGDPSVGTVRSQKGRQRPDTRDERHDEQSQHTVAHGRAGEYEKRYFLFLPRPPNHDTTSWNTPSGQITEQ